LVELFEHLLLRFGLHFHLSAQPSVVGVSHPQRLQHPCDFFLELRVLCHQSSIAVRLLSARRRPARRRT
jgi:hypothetical protein